MILHFAILENELFNCNIRINDAKGAHYYQVPQIDPLNKEPLLLDVEIEGSECDIAIAPIECDTDKIYEDKSSQTFFNKITSKLAKKVFSSITEAILRVTCEYHLCNLKNEDCINIVAKQYIYGVGDRWYKGGCVPISYSFYEVEHNGKRAKVKQAFGTNRNEMMKNAKQLAFLTALEYLLIIYPFEVSRIRNLSKDKEVIRTIQRFNEMTPEERTKIEKWKDQNFE